MSRFIARARLSGIALALGCLLAGAHATDVGQAAPELELQGAAGAQKLSDLKGKVVYVDFWASWCGPCRQSFPWMNEMQAKYGPRGLQVVAVNLDAKRSDADQFLAQLPAQFALAFDSKGESARRFGVKGMPTSVLIGADGKVTAVHQGFREDERQVLEQRLVAALASR
jgi:cytochrome c biogenesis protein CcmG, thiol:disulfide interchange protein DsbE